MADIIDELLAMDEAALSAKLGFAAKLDQAKKDLGEMAKLEGKAREHATERVSRMFQPNVYPDEFKWIAEDAQRKAGAGAKTTPSEIVSCCCGNPEDY